MKKIAFVTSSISPEISVDDLILVDALRAHEVECIAAPWDDPAINWASFDLVLLRSCWNYHLLPEKFATWINAIKDGKISMFNQAELVLWNLNKYYLKELQEKGVNIPETAWISESEFYEERLSDILRERKWDCAVLKPCISASSFRTNIITALTASEEGRFLFANRIKGGMVLQKYVEEIPKNGELSLMFFNGAFSHAVIKQAKPGDFRVQHQFGGQSKSTIVRNEIIKAAEKILSLLPVKPLYARVDGVEINNVFHLMELELIEPVLFLKQDHQAASRFAAEVLSLLKENREVKHVA
jgi:hypothetical protein